MIFTLLDPPKLFSRIYGGLHHTAAFPNVRDRWYIFAAFVVVVQALWGPSRSKLSKLLK